MQICNVLSFDKYFHTLEDFAECKVSNCTCDMTDINSLIGSKNQCGKYT